LALSKAKALKRHVQKWPLALKLLELSTRSQLVMQLLRAESLQFVAIWAPAEPVTATLALLESDISIFKYSQT
jgi:hypothetical protein